MSSKAEQTALGYRMKLTKISNKTLYGGDIARITLDVEFLTDTRLRFKVSILAEVLLIDWSFKTFLSSVSQIINQENNFLKY